MNSHPDDKTRYRILVVDDDHQIRELTNRALAREGMDCDTATDGAIAEDMVSARAYDAVVTDLRMPREHGHTLIMHLFERSSPPLVVVITGVMEPRIAADLFRRGVADIVYKPFPFDVFAIKLKLMLGHWCEQGQHSREQRVASVTKEIAGSTAALKAQLAEVQGSFQSTIEQLEKQQEELEAGFLDSVRVLSNLVSHLGQSKGSHAGRVERMCASIGERIGMNHVDARNMRLAALLHDIGQFGMPDDVRGKPFVALSKEDRQVFRTYPVIGATLLSEIRGAGEVVELVESHAENYDGSGFPHGKRSDAIPQGARVIRIADGCDTFVVMGAKERSRDELREHLQAQKGRAYDPELLSPAIAYIREQSVACEEERTVNVIAPELTAGHILAENVYDDEGRLLARQGARLTETMIPRLLRLLDQQSVKVILPPGRHPRHPRGK